MWAWDKAGVLRMTPEGLCGRRKLTAALRRGGLFVAESSVARAMKPCSIKGSGASRTCGPRSRPRTGAAPETCSIAISRSRAEPEVGHRLHLMAEPRVTPASSRRLTGAPEISRVQVWCRVVSEPLTGDHSFDATGRRGLNVDGGPVSRRVRDRLVRCGALERFH